jgi:hypothetical protein
MIEGGRTRDGSTALESARPSPKLGVVDLVKTVTSSDSCIQDKEVESHAQHKGSAHCIYVHYGAYSQSVSYLIESCEVCNASQKYPHLILPWYHYGAVIGNTSLRQDCPVFRVDTPCRHSALGHEKC